MKLKKLVAGVLSAAMMLSIGSTLAFATDVDITTSTTDVGTTMTATIKTTMYLSEAAVTAPDVDYSYTLSAGATATFTDTESATTTIYAGEMGDEVDETSAIVNFSDGITITEGVAETTIAFIFTAANFSNTGIYHYVLKESADTVEGVVNETDQTRHIYVTVLVNGSGDYYIDQIVMSEGAMVDESKKGTDYTKSEGYIHSCGLGDDDGEPNPNPESGLNITVTFDAVGDMADSTKLFAFTTSTTLSEAYKDSAFPVYDASGNATEYYYIVDESYALVLATKSGDDYTTEDVSLSLKDEGSFVIKGLATGVTYTVEIDTTDATYTYYTYDATTEKWVGGYSDTTNETATLKFAAAKGVLTEEEEEKFPEITSAATIPSTGVVLDLAPYAVMMVLALGAISFRFVRVARKEEE